MDSSHLLRVQLSEKDRPVQDHAQQRFLFCAIKPVCSSPRIKQGMFSIISPRTRFSVTSGP